MESVSSLENIGNGVVVVDFYADWCSPCKLLGPIFEKVSQAMPSVKFIKVNADDAQSVVRENGINALPTILIFKDGKVAKRHVGMINERSLISEIEAVQNA